jgi:hypothetical protein
MHPNVSNCTPWQGEVSNQEVVVALETQVSLYKGSVDTTGTGLTSLALPRLVLSLQRLVLIQKILFLPFLIITNPWRAS